MPDTEGQIALLNAIEGVLDAWRFTGINPNYHAQQKRELQKKWPVLYKALVALDQKAGAPSQ